MMGILVPIFIRNLLNIFITTQSLLFRTDYEYYNNEYWFITHIVHHSKPRHYYHCMVVLDGETLKYKRHSRFFTFDSECVEFCLGLIIEDERIITTHSNWDSTSKLYVYDKETLLKDLFEQILTKS